MSWIKSILNTFAYTTTGTLLGAAVYTELFWKNFEVSMGILWQILAVGFLCSLGNLLYYNGGREKSEKWQFLLRVSLHYLYINGVVIGCGLLFEWFYWYRLDMMAAIVAVILVIFVVIWTVSYQKDKRLAERLNEKLRGYYQKE
ncbi:DUF3021 domain-containing protein [Konateibacter massiliensis]|uniref:DUF3021 domain-containing protein n=1 Tax=Konateibacter massiliensis TaxID=2002841 RepID=UPI000C14FF35|nr:DUF3021 domain-containing protein [Konateibacter massiliensis]